MKKKRKKNKKKDSFDLLQSVRSFWNLNPVTKVHTDKTKYTRKKKHKTNEEY